MKTYAVIAAAGSGSRMKNEVNKQFLLLDGVPVLAYTLRAFDRAAAIDEVIVVTRPQDILIVSDLVREFGIQKATAILPGGETRQESVRRGLASVGKDDLVLIHDGARPLVSPGLIDRIADALHTAEAVAPGVPVKDTIKEVGADGRIAKTLDRASLVQIQTPQGFRSGLLHAAHAQALRDGVAATDDCTLLEALGVAVTVIPGEYTNIKITTPEDLAVAEGLLRWEAEECE